MFLSLLFILLIKSQETTNERPSLCEEIAGQENNRIYTEEHDIVLCPATPPPSYDAHGFSPCVLDVEEPSISRSNTIEGTNDFNQGFWKSTMNNIQKNYYKFILVISFIIGVNVFALLAYSINKEYILGVPMITIVSFFILVFYYLIKRS
ncbi:hypothetical protein NGRA_0121 [Nosema granulosis]|uniref:Uncharacterized protein n=1 Tax=Nosema granulosis TaxID=83296 RepID=A0A9P6H3J5_9MICR|nr:hypothetical protein NGRA_0121 [Nosema granulosis]